MGFWGKVRPGASSLARLLGWPLFGPPEDPAARADRMRRQAERKRQAAEQRQAELQRQAADRIALAAGKIPMLAAQRLAELRIDTPGAIFTGDLSPAEAAILRRAGYRARGLVTGSAVYHVGQAYASSQGDCEVSVLSNAYDHAMELAVGRLQQEVQVMGAHGVVGVRLALVRHEWVDQTIEVVVIGTAIEGPGSTPKTPWLCDLSVEEWWTLHQAGYDAIGLVWGHSSWFVLTTQADEWTVRSWNNEELTHWSRALGQARTRAMFDVRNRTRQLGATGIAGVRLSRRLDEVRLSGGEGGVYEREHHNVVVAIIGTALKVADRPTQHRPTRTVLSLREGRLLPVGVGAGDLAVKD
ncbi:MAG: heavy metal-binding domain-containing protein [Cyanobacteria bacterium REEB65]|nr:heavy metal-binding domain-containing protein [Cyanobacteria bacterium REEB65]